MNAPRAHAREPSDDCDVAYTDASCCWQARDVAALGICEQLHHTDGCKPSDTTRSRARFVPAPELSRVVACSRHRLLSSLSDADLAEPLLIQLTDAAMDTQDLRRAWDLHVQRDRTLSYKTASRHTEGAQKTLSQAWEDDGLSIQHDLDDMASVENPVLDFLRMHPELRYHGLWARLEEWILSRVGPISRRPAFINGFNVKATTTHFDEYASFALVLTGAKTFHIAPPSLVHQTGRGMEHESSATPYKPGTAREQDVPQPFVRVRIGAGCLLYLPPRWWHYVDSQPKTIMLCAWV